MHTTAVMTVGSSRWPRPTVLSARGLLCPMCRSVSIAVLWAMEDAVVDLSAGTAAGVAQLVVGHPFDTVKVRLQLGGAGTTVQTIQSILQSRGPAGFYCGMAAPLATVAAFNALLFCSWGAAERLLSPSGAPLTVAQAALAGALAGVPVSLLATPTELLKCRLQAQRGRLPLPGQVYSLAEVRAGRALFRGPLEVLRHVVRHEGGVLAGCYRGLAPTLLREVPGTAAYFCCYEGAKAAFAGLQGMQTSELGAASLMAAGGLAGAAFWVVCYPADVIKSNLQTQNVFAQDRFRGTVDCAMRLYQAHGWQGLYRGFTPALLRSVPANAVAFLAFEKCRAALSA